MIHTRLLRGMRVGDQIAVVGDQDQQKNIEAVTCTVGGKFKYHKVLLVDHTNCSTWYTNLIECIEEIPAPKKRGRKAK